MAHHFLSYWFYKTCIFFETAPVRIDQEGHMTRVGCGLNTTDCYVRDLIVWGTNAIELISSDPDIDPDEHLRLTAKFADIIASYGLQVWLWYPIDDPVPVGVRGEGLEAGSQPCPSKPDGRRYILERRRKLFRALKIWMLS
jgi:hypothetical protein